MENYLEMQFEENKLKHIKNFLDFCKNVFSQKFYKGKEGPINIGMSISMAIAKNSTLEESLAGWNLTFVMIKKKKNENIPENDKNVILNKLKEDVIKKFPLIEYYIDYYL